MSASSPELRVEEAEAAIILSGAPEPSNTNARSKGGRPKTQHRLAVEEYFLAHPMASNEDAIAAIGKAINGSVIRNARKELRARGFEMPSRTAAARRRRRGRSQSGALQIVDPSVAVSDPIVADADADDVERTPGRPHVPSEVKLKIAEQIRLDPLADNKVIFERAGARICRAAVLELRRDLRSEGVVMPDRRTHAARWRRDRVGEVAPRPPSGPMPEAETVADDLKHCVSHGCDLLAESGRRHCEMHYATDRKPKMVDLVVKAARKKANAELLRSVEVVRLPTRPAPEERISAALQSELDREAARDKQISDRRRAQIRAERARAELERRIDRRYGID